MSAAAEQWREPNGRWQEMLHADAGSTVLADFEWEPDESFPYPQANDLDKVALCVDIVTAGADTAEAVAEALDLSPREGAYYANAAGWLGLLERGHADDPDGAVYRVAPLGERFAACGAAERANALAFVVAQIDDAQEGDPMVVELRLVRDGLDQSTARRRAQTMRSWRTQTGDRAGLGGLIGAGWADDQVQRWAQAAQRASIRRAEAAAKVVRVLHGQQCPSCFQTMPLTGQCDNCN